MSGDGLNQCDNDTSVSDFIESVPGVGRVTRVKLEKSGYETVGEIRNSDEEDLAKVPLVGPKTATKLLEFANETLAPHSEVAISNTQQRRDSISLEVWLEDVPKVGRVNCANLNKSGYGTVADIQDADADELVEVDTIGPTTAERVLDSVKGNLSNRDTGDVTEETGDEQDTSSGTDKSPDTVNAIMSDLELADGS